MVNPSSFPNSLVRRQLKIRVKRRVQRPLLCLGRRADIPICNPRTRKCEEWWAHLVGLLAQDIVFAFKGKRPSRNPKAATLEAAWLLKPAQRWNLGKYAFGAMPTGGLTFLRILTDRRSTSICRL